MRVSSSLTGRTKKVKKNLEIKNILLTFVSSKEVTISQREILILIHFHNCFVWLIKTFSGFKVNPSLRRVATLSSKTLAVK